MTLGFELIVMHTPNRSGCESDEDLEFGRRIENLSFALLPYFSIHYHRTEAK